MWALFQKLYGVNSGSGEALSDGIKVSHSIGRAVESSRVPAHPRLPCHESWTSLWDSPDAPPFPAGQLSRGFQTGIRGFREAGGEEQGKLPPATGRPAPAAMGPKPAPSGVRGDGGLGLFALTTPPSIGSGRAEARLAQRCPRAATPNPAAPSTGGGSARPATSAAPPAPPPWERGMRGMRGMRERGMRERRSPAFPAGEPSPVLLLFPAIHHRLPLSLGHRGCHPAVTEVEKNEPFKRGRARDAREHETN